MTKPASQPDPAPLRETLRACGQEQLLAFWDELDAAGRGGLAAQIEGVDLLRIDRLFREGATEVDWEARAARAEAPPAMRLDGKENRFSADEARARGRAALEAGEVGVLLVAGGQGTRLGFAHPKGLFPIGPVSGASLLQIHIEKVLATAERYGAPVPLYLMTSPATHDETLHFLKSRDRFGLAADLLHVFCQGTMPAVDARNGKLLLAARDRLFLSPDGHGGMVAALACSGGSADIGRRGLQQLFYFQVDNPLVPVCDPELIGYHILARSELSSVVVAKQAAEEPLGNVVSIDGTLQIIEYSDLPATAAERRTSDGRLELWAGNTAIHVFDAPFLCRHAERQEGLPFHVARKPVPCLDAEGRPVEPQTPNALKFEQFIFDLLPAAANAIVIEADPRDAFAPLKNAPGAPDDTPDAVRRKMNAQHRRWLETAGAKIAPDAVVEIGPRWALDAEMVGEQIDAGTEIDEDTYFGRG